MGERGQDYFLSYIHGFKDMLKCNKLDNIKQLALDSLFLIQKELETKSTNNMTSAIRNSAIIAAHAILHKSTSWIKHYLVKIKSKGFQSLLQLP